MKCLCTASFVRAITYAPIYLAAMFASACIPQPFTPPAYYPPEITVINGTVPSADSIATLKYVKKIISSDTAKPQYPELQGHYWELVSYTTRNGSQANIDARVNKPSVAFTLGSPYGQIDSATALIAREYPLAAFVRTGMNTMNCGYGIDAGGRIRIRVFSKTRLSTADGRCPYCERLETLIVQLTPRWDSYNVQQDTLWVSIR